MEIKSKELLTIFAWRKSDWLGEAGPPRRGGCMRAPAECAHLGPRSQHIFGAVVHAPGAHPATHENG